MSECKTVDIVRARLAAGRTIADADVHRLVAEVDRLRALLARWLVECDPSTGNMVDLFEDTEDALQSAKQDGRHMTAQEFMRAALFFYGDKPDAERVSLGHWITPEPDPEKMRADTLPRFEADMSVTVGEIRRMAEALPSDFTPS